MSIYAVASQLQTKGIGFQVIAATPEAQYITEWLRLLASFKDFTYRMQTSHWAVRSSKFREMHDLFGEWYNNSFNMEDQAAEQVKMLDIDYVIPNTPDSLSKYSVLDVNRPDAQVHKPRVLLVELYKCLKQLHAHVVVLNKQAEQAEDVAGVDLLGQMAGTLQKGLWFVKAYLKK
jgi:DNA-binding ferritin-like protein